MKKRRIDLEGAESPEEVYRRIAEALDLPGYYGRNLDALYDCLTEIDEDTCIGVYGSMGPPEEYLSRVRRVFCDAEEENAHLCVFLFPEAGRAVRSAETEAGRTAAAQGAPGFLIREEEVEEMFAEEEAEMMGLYGGRGEDNA